MTPGTWKFTKIKRFDSIQFSWPRVQENPQKSEASYSRTIFKDFLEFEQAISPDWQKEAIAESFTKIWPQKAKLWPQNGIPLVAKKWNNQKIESNISPDWQN